MLSTSIREKEREVRVEGIDSVKGEESKMLSQYLGFFSHSCFITHTFKMCIKMDGDPLYNCSNMSSCLAVIKKQNVFQYLLYLVFQSKSLDTFGYILSKI